MGSLVANLRELVGLGPRENPLMKAGDDRKEPVFTLAQVMPGIRSIPVRRGTREFLLAYSTSPWLRAIVAKISASVASTEWHVYQQVDGRKKIIADHPMISFLDSGNAHMTGFQARKLTQVYLELVGEAFWVLEKNALGMPISFMPVPPTWIIDVARPTRPYYVFNIPNGFHGQLPAEDVVWFKEIDPLYPYERGVSAARALADELDIDEAAAKHLSAFLANRARPDLIITAKQSKDGGGGGFSKDDAARLEARWIEKHGGPQKQGRPSFMPGEIEIHELGQTLMELQMVPLRQNERDIIISVFGIPPEKLGVLHSSNRASIQAADMFYAKDVIDPRLQDFRAMMQQRVIPMFDPSLKVGYDSPVDDDETFKLEVMKAFTYAFQVDEIRALAGKESLPDGKGQVFGKAFTIQMVDNLDPVAPIQPGQANPNGAPPPTGDLSGGKPTNGEPLPADSGKPAAAAAPKDETGSPGSGGGDHQQSQNTAVDAFAAKEERAKLVVEIGVAVAATLAAHAAANPVERIDIDGLRREIHERITAGINSIHAGTTHGLDTLTRAADALARLQPSELKVEMPPITVNLTAGSQAVTKTVSIERDATGKLVGTVTEAPI